MRTHLTIVGGGIGGLVAAAAARQAGFDVTLHEARPELGGRARTTSGPYRANWGPHVVYGDGATWRWLDQQGLAEPAARVPVVPRTRFRVDGQARALPPVGVVRGLLRLRRPDAPVDASFAEWAASRLRDETAAARIANLMGVATFDHDPGRLSAAFVQERLRRATAFPPTVRYVPGGWATLVERLAGHAGRLGVAIETNSRVDRLPAPPVILAVTLPQAAALTGDASLTWHGTRTALLDLGMRRRRRDPFFLSDLDASGWAETYSVPDPTLAPDGHQLVQCQAGLRPGESLTAGVDRLEALVDTAYPGWRRRETFRRRLVVEDESGGLELPGETWRDRPASDRGDGVYVVSDMVAAPGTLSEVAVNAALGGVAALATGTRLRQVA